MPIGRIKSADVEKGRRKKESNGYSSLLGNSGFKSILMLKWEARHRF
jgi:hypothetical protein